MNAFNFDIADSIHVDTTDDGAILRFGSNTLGFVPSSDGYSITNDWNNRHFTIAFSENSVLYHLTREDIDERTGGRHLNRGEFVSEMYGYVRSMAHPVPDDYVDFETVFEYDFDAGKEFLEDEGVVKREGSGFTVDHERQDSIVEELAEDSERLLDFYKRVLDPVPFDEVRDSGEIVFARPLPDRVDLVFLYPDGYIGVVNARDLFDRLDDAGGSMIIDQVFRSITTE